MAMIPIPDAFRLDDAVAAARSVIVSDQFDDWLPDPVLFADYARSESSLRAMLARALAGGELAWRAHDAMAIVSGDDAKFTAVALPLHVRAAVGGMILPAAPQMWRSLITDKVYGLEPAEAGGRRASYADHFHTRHANDAAAEWRHDECRMDADDLGWPDDWAFLPSGLGARGRLFRPADDALAACFEALAELLSEETEHVSIEWRDVRRFFPSVKLDGLFERLRLAGLPPAAAGALRTLLDRVRPDDAADGLVSADDAVGFLANFHLAPVDEALARNRTLFMRVRDEYFLIGTDGSPLNGGDAVLRRALDALGLRINPDKSASFATDEADHSGDCGGDLEWASQLFEPLPGRLRMHLYAEGTYVPGPSKMSISVSTAYWPNLLRTILHAPEPVPRLSAVFHMLRVANTVRRWTILEPPEDPPNQRDHRTRKYREALRTRANAGAIGRRIADAAARANWWQAAWLVRLGADLGPLAETHAPGAFAVLLGAPDAPAYAKAEAALAVCKTTANAQAAAAALDAVRGLTGEHVERVRTAAAYFAQRRLGGGALDDAPDPALREFLRTHLRG